jgi:hypothetical protein
MTIFDHNFICRGSAGSYIFSIGMTANSQIRVTITNSGGNATFIACKSETSINVLTMHSDDGVSQSCKDDIMPRSVQVNVDLHDLVMVEVRAPAQSELAFVVEAVAS